MEASSSGSVAAVGRSEMLASRSRAAGSVSAAGGAGGAAVVCGGGLLRVDDARDAVVVRRP